ncbi:MAG: hypothetical protein K0Q94_6338 [Paenibacillus sp.]|jgi:hypothetical protein|nr:hypothetical protein [Paenibacillus sp.]
MMAAVGLMMLSGYWLLLPERFSERFFVRMSARISACIVFLMEQTAYLLDGSVILRAAERTGYAKRSNHAVQSLSMLSMKSFMLLIKLHRFKEPDSVLFRAAMFLGCLRRGGLDWIYGNERRIRVNGSRMRTG